MTEDEMMHRERILERIAKLKSEIDMNQGVIDILSKEEGLGS